MGSTTKPASEYREIEYVREHIRKAALMVANDAEAAFCDEIHQRMEGNASEDALEHETPFTFDSPLEAAFWVWWMAYRESDVLVKGLLLARHVSVQLHGKTYVLDFVLRPIASRYRRPADELVRRWPKVGIELDGHTFHEKTREQVSYRNQRDRALQQAGWQIFHFSYDEFTKQPDQAVLEVIEWVREREMRLSMEIYTSKHANDTQTEG